MIDKRWVELVTVLHKSGKDIPVKELEKKLKLSVKTIKQIIEQNEEDSGAYGFHILNRFALGYSLIIDNDQKFHEFLSMINTASDETTMRIYKIIEKLVQTQDYIRIEDMAEEMFVSRATLDRLMPKVKEIVQRYQLTITHKAKFGIRLEGKEINKRLCYAHEVKKYIMDNHQEMTLRIQKILKDVIKEYNLMMNDINLYNLVQHCVIAIHRISNHNFIQDAFKIQMDNHDIEKKAAHDIVKHFENAFQIQIPDGEEQYIMMHLLGKRILNNFDAISEDVLSCIDDIVFTIKEQMGIDLLKDHELKAALALHIQPLLSRLTFGFKQQNPILLEIKREMNQAFELALCAAKIINERYHLNTSEDEMGYLALHFAVALDKKEKAISDKKIIVVCASGRGTAKLFHHRLINRYHFKDENLILASAFDLETIDFSDILCILTTIPLAKTYPVPIILIDMLLNQQSFEKVDKAIENITFQQDILQIIQNGLIIKEQNYKNKEELLSDLCKALMQHYQLNDDFEFQVKKREEASSTEVGNMVALPHPYFYEGSHIVFSIMSLKQPIVWKYGEVQLIILMALPKQESLTANKLSDIIAQLVNDENKVEKLIHHLDMETLLEGMNKK